jgi:hypothetical protein
MTTKFKRGDLVCKKFDMDGKLLFEREPEIILEIQQPKDRNNDDCSYCNFTIYEIINEKIVYSKWSEFYEYY